VIREFSIRTTFVFALVGVACVTSIAAAQRGTTGGQTGSKIQPVDAQQSGKHEPSGLGKRIVRLDMFATVSAADKAYAVARLDEFERIVLKAVPEFGHLKYPIWATVSGFAESPPRPNGILEYRYGLVADLGLRGHCDILDVKFNQIAEGLPGETIVQDWLGKPVPGAITTRAELIEPPDPSYEHVMFARTGEAPYVQLTREEFRRSQILEDEGANGEKLAKRKKQLANTPYEQFMAGAAERKQGRDALAVALNGLKSPAEIAAQIKEMEDTEREGAARLKAQETDDRKQNDSLSRAPSVADNARASIARMSAAERKMPAYVLSDVSDTLYNFGTAESPLVRRVVRANPSFWIMHRSRVEVRSIDVGFIAACPKEPPPPEVHAALWKLRQTIDWGAIKRMVNQP